MHKIEQNMTITQQRIRQGTRMLECEKGKGEISPGAAMLCEYFEEMDEKILEFFYGN